MRDEVPKCSCDCEELFVIAQHESRDFLAQSRTIDLALKQLASPDIGLHVFSNPACGRSVETCPSSREVGYP